MTVAHEDLIEPRSAGIQQRTGFDNDVPAAADFRITALQVGVQRDCVLSDVVNVGVVLRVLELVPLRIRTRCLMLAREHHEAPIKTDRGQALVILSRRCIRDVRGVGKRRNGPETAVVEINVAVLVVVAASREPIAADECDVVAVGADRRSDRIECPGMLAVGLRLGHGDLGNLRGIVEHRPGVDRDCFDVDRNRAGAGEPVNAVRDDILEAVGPAELLQMACR